MKGKRNNTKDILSKIESWRPDYLDCYVEKDKSKLITENVKCKLSFQNPKLTTQQELGTTFILSIHEFIREK